ncbi:EF hand [Rubripirellula lacrimiformis]|uniref:EF hand n=1 Tax=Rubripirellula lacrimiformis TaxID=1930273 RepID=A0A517ND40_9BACT|nr:hypothetical protein [Rubripirellula lacrimiformis]QDT05055.1 EF hand [Rubripirellula lacrimiformis]
MKRLPLLSVFCVIAFLFTDTLLNAQPPGGRPGQGGLRQGGSGGPAGRGGERGPGMGGPNSQQTPPLLRIFDADADGELSSKEIDAAANALRGLDQNRDGKLTAEELRPAGPGGQRGDGQRDSGQRGIGPGAGGRAAGDQAAGGRAADGRAVGGGRGQQAQRGGRQSVGGPPRSMGNGRPDGGPPESGRPGGGGGGGRGGDPAQADAAFAKEIMSFDEDKDGLLSQAELPEHMHKAFAVADANRDGSLDPAELLVLASQFRRNQLNPADDTPVNAPSQGGRPNRSR